MKRSAFAVVAVLAVLFALTGCAVFGSADTCACATDMACICDGGVDGECPCCGDACACSPKADGETGCVCVTDSCCCEDNCSCGEGCGCAATASDTACACPPSGPGEASFKK